MQRTETETAGRPGARGSDRGGGRALARMALAVLGLGLGAALVAAVWGGGAAPPPAGAQGASRRHADPVVVGGAWLPALQGAPLAELSVWILRGGAWERVPIQIDERDATGAYLAAEDGRLDAEDELVFVLGAPGERASAGAWPPGLPEGPARHELRLTDPLDPAFEAWYYLFRSPGTPAESVPPVVRWDPVAREVRTEAYVLGLADQAADGFVGIDALSLHGDGADLVDRLKIRGNLAAFGFEQPVDEETLLAALQVAGLELGFEPVIHGPLRVVLAEAGGFAYADRFALFPDLSGIEDALGGGGPLAVELRDARLSIDFSAQAAGARYRDANLPEGVAIDGQADTVPQGPVPSWREIGFANGRLAILSGAVPGDSAARVYYRDDAAGPAGDTGDGQSFGDNGVLAPDLGSLVEAGFPGEAVVLPPGSPVDPAVLAANRLSPLAIEVTGVVLPTAAPTAGRTPSPTAAASATRPPSPEPSPTRVRPEPRQRLHLPNLRRSS